MRRRSAGFRRSRCALARIATSATITRRASGSRRNPGRRSAARPEQHSRTVSASLSSLRGERRIPASFEDQGLGSLLRAMPATVLPMQAQLPIHPALREVVERLAQVERGPGRRRGRGGRLALRALEAGRLRGGGRARGVLRRLHETDRTLTAVAALGGLLALRRRGRVLGGLAAAAAAALIADDVANTWRVFRKLSKPRPTQNVVGDSR